MAHDLVHDNPNMREPVLTVLGLFVDGEPRRREEVEQTAREAWKPGFRQSPTVTVDALVRKRALVERTFVAGEPYAGTLEDAQRDESLPDDAEAFTALTITELGRDLFEAYQPACLLSTLADGHPQYCDAYAAALWACADERGCSRDELEAQLRQLPALQRNPETGHTEVYPQYFIDALESAGGIAWHDGSWRVTPAGREVLAQL